MTGSCPQKTARICELNDELRCKSVGGRIVITPGIHALGTAAVCQVLADGGGVRQLHRGQ